MLRNLVSTSQHRVLYDSLVVADHAEKEGFKPHEPDDLEAQMPRLCDFVLNRTRFLFIPQQGRISFVATRSNQTAQRYCSHADLFGSGFEQRLAISVRR